MSQAGIGAVFLLARSPSLPFKRYIKYFKYIFENDVQCWASVADGGPAKNQYWVFSTVSRSSIGL